MADSWLRSREEGSIGNEVLSPKEREEVLRSFKVTSISLSRDLENKVFRLINERLMRIMKNAMVCHPVSNDET